MSVRSKKIRSIVVIGPVGQFYGGRETDELGAAIDEALASGNTRLVLDMSECEWLNSTALGVIAKANHEYKLRQGTIKLCGLGKKLQTIFATTRLIMEFGHYDSEMEAIASFAEGAV
jgi:anti-anti-sigma factor